MSYVVEVAIGIDDKAANRDTRLVPHRSRGVPRRRAGHAFRRPHPALRARARRLRLVADPQSGGDTLCVAPDNFVIAAARQCRSGQTPAPFTQVNPTQTDDGNLVCLSRRGQRV